ncbi:hypothetical protein JX265_004653 [Neoarthrinium moseri]|uniref:Cystathionine beta-synthase n=1 Tax=Neoarthrinium moseri TaxID=1658444 RepID=A0A9P9WPT7_9PEZI|nr:uncharacterized protein JN550_003844 [Neoarthrinium moseri]KAI1840937.1 hypothetical protein JX266_012873 [Neoarthrinium moseri]KAI1872970.1 hypothetical protein JN550_003844 [Neoarthrinium moseri]KAI1874445.1 hypothetical protein JX265_004653 [Neoarthrinium moseri]
MASTIGIKGAHIGPSPLGGKPFVSKWSNRYRGATVQDLEPPSALSLNPSDPISLALLSAFERDYTHLTIIDSSTRSLLGYIAIPQLQAQLDGGHVKPEDPLSAAMVRFQRKGRTYKVITMATPLEELEEFFEGGGVGQKQDFAVVTDEARRFVLGVATKDDLEEFVKRRPA